MRRLRLCWVLSLLFLQPVCCYAMDQETEQAQMQEILEEVNLQEADEALSQMGMDTLTETTQEILLDDGESWLQDWKDRILQMVIPDWSEERAILGQAFFLILLAALLRCVSDTTLDKSTEELGFFICYCVLVTIFLRLFTLLASEAGERIGHLLTAFRAMLPAFFTLSASSGEVGKTMLMGGTVIGAANILSAFSEKYALPLLSLSLTLEMVNCLPEKPLLQQFCALFKSCLRHGMKYAAYIFLLLLSLQKIGGGALGALAEKAAQIAVGAVPVVGDVLSGAVESAAAMVSALRSGVLSGAVLLLFLYGLPFLCKLGLLILLLRLTAAFAEPFGEERLTNCITALADHIAILMGLVFLTDGLFFFSSLLLLGEL